MKRIMICASCDNLNTVKFNAGISITPKVPDAVVKACVPIMYIMSSFMKPALLRGLNYVSAVDSNTDVTKYITA